MKNEEISPRDRILNAADRLFYTEGIRATGTETIMAAAEVAKATFYRCFESKDALVLAYLDWRDRGFWEFLLATPEPRNVGEAMEKIQELVNRQEVAGCPFLHAASEYPDPNHPFHRRAVEHKQKLLSYLTELLPSTDKRREVTGRKLLALVDGALSARMIFGTTQQIPLLSWIEATGRLDRSTVTKRLTRAR